MGAITGLLGAGNGAAGTQFAGPGGVSGQQLQTSYDANQQALAQQQGLLNALQGQNGIQNQSNIYSQLQNVASGQGPNPAQAMLNQATGQNVSNQAALMAGQRGAGSNVGLIARQAAMQGSNAQQQAAGQGATMQAQQSLGALGAAGNIANTQVANQIGATGAVTGAQQAEQGNLLNTQSNINAANAQLAGAQIQGSQAAAAGMAGSGISSLLAAGGRVGYDDGGDVSDDTAPPDFGNFGTGVSDTASMGALLPRAKPGVGGGAGKAAIMALMADGGGVTPNAFVSTGPQSMFGQFVSKMNAAPVASIMPSASAAGMGKGIGDAAKKLMSSLSTKDPSTIQEGNAHPVTGPTGNPQQIVMTESPSQSSQDAGATSGGDDGGDGGGDDGGGMAEGGNVKALVSPGEVWLSPEAVEQVRKGADPMRVGKVIPGKPKVGGAVNSYTNDTVRAKLEVGGIVIPRSKTKSTDPSRNSREFVSKTLAKRKVE